jgi:HEPN domain-containing protein
MKSDSYQEETKYSWLEFAQSFLLLAKLACQELEDKRKNKHNKTTRYDPQEYNLPYTCPDLFISIIFNIKHGLEVFIKTIKLLSTDNYERGHDIKELFDDLKKTLPKRIKPLKDAEGNEIKQEDIDAIPNTLEDLENLILKYYHCDFLNENKKVVNIYDEMNDVFRYPENKAKVKIDLDLADENLIKTIHEDIDKIYRLFNNLGYIIDVAKNLVTEDSSITQEENN